MKRLTLFILSLIIALPAHASSPSDAREVARLNNCPPKKIEVFQQSLGSQGTTTYRVECNMPKTVGEVGKGPDALLIGCDESICSLLRPVSVEKK